MENISNVNHVAISTISHQMPLSRNGYSLHRRSERHYAPSALQLGKCTHQAMWLAVLAILNFFYMRISSDTVPHCKTHILAIDRKLAYPGKGDMKLSKRISTPRRSQGTAGFAVNLSTTKCYPVISVPVVGC